MSRTCLVLTVTWIIASVLNISVRAVELDSSQFEFKYSGSDILDGDTFLNDWSVAGDANVGELLDGASIELNERGNILMKQTPDNRNFWLQQDSGASPWEDGVGDSWTLEVRAHLIGTEPDGDPVNNGFNLWGADGFQRGIVTIQENSVQSFGRPGEQFLAADNDDGFHTYRMGYDITEDLYFIWRDGELLSTDGFLAQAATGNDRLIVGDCCTAANDINPFIFEELEIEYIRYDLDGIFDPVPVEPVPGDYNGNGDLDAGDLDLQAEATAGKLDPPEFDLNGDSAVDYDDRLMWVNDLKKTLIGDANLDLEFNSSDMVHVFAQGKYETVVAAVWQDGDWNGDLEFNSSDMVAAFANGGYEQGPRPAGVASGVPEPSSVLLIAIGLLTLSTRRRRLGIA